MTVTAVVDVDNFSACGKSILEAEKKKKVIIKGGCFEGQYIDADVVRKYASIPSKKELYGMLAGSLNSIIGKIAFVLNEVKEKKEEEKK